jgi:Transglycosylase SLT domain
MQLPESLWRAASRRWRLAIVIAAAVVLPGGVGAGTMAMMPTEADPPSVPGLSGTLPFQDDEALEPYLDAEMLAAVPVGADPVSEPVRAVLSSARVIDSLGESGIPTVAVDAYVRAADRLGSEDPGCGIRWTLLAAIGRVESNHGRFGGAMLRDDGYSTKPIRGIPLDGRPNVALIADTDAGVLDGDTQYDRAVGPMQFIPSTWRSVGVDGNGDGRRDPDNLFDAAYGAARYLCQGDADLRSAGGRAQAVRRYNNADEYVRVVLNLADMYETGAVARLPAIGLPPMEPVPPPRPSPGPPEPAPDRPGGATPGSSGPAAPAPPPAPPGPVPPAAPSPAPPAPPASPRPAPTPATPAPTTTSTTTAPPRTTAPAAPPATALVPPPTTSSTTTPPTTAPEPAAPTTSTTTVPVDPAPEPPATPEEPPAAVGWAPAMREVVVDILEESPAPTAPAAPAAPEAPAAPPESPRSATPTAPPAPAAPAAPSAPPESPEPPPPAEPSGSGP